MIRTRATTDDSQSERERRHRDLARRAAQESVVLLRNENDVLPIRPCRLALYGAGAAATVKGGSGSGEVNERYSVSILEGLERAGFEIATRAWLDDYKKTCRQEREAYARAARRKFLSLRRGRFAAILATPFRLPSGRRITGTDIADSRAETCVYVVARQAGEGADRRLDAHDNALSQVERDNIAACARAYPRMILAINAGSSIDLDIVDDTPGIDGLIFVGQLGCEGGNAFADIVTGRASPSARLSATWPKRYDDIPFARDYSYLNGDLDNEDYKEGVFVGYRFFDSFDVAPRFEFGFGLSYARFTQDCIGISVDGRRATLHARVRNESDRFSGKHVVQVYVGCPQTARSREFQILAGFAKTRELAPGECESLEIAIDLTGLAAYDPAETAFILDAGDYAIRLGPSSRDARAAALLTLDRRIVLSRHQPICTEGPDFEDLSPGAARKIEPTAGLPRAAIDPDAFCTVIHRYDKPERPPDPALAGVLDRLDARDMLRLVVGEGGLSLLFGKGYFTAPGACGVTTSSLVRKGVVNIAMADGPAGLRLQRRSALTRCGAVRMVDPYIEVMRYLPRLARPFVFGDPGRDRLLYQFATAWPAAFSLAQSWNPALLEDVGRAVGEEMVEYGVTVWLAPGMNIQRNPLCGRNFEYYSEDPFLTGKLAAATARGCQSVGGTFVALKHFCANNQEDNRFHVSSNVSERALREIYLKGFEIAVREGGARGVMSAYNKINGVYASNHHGLLTRVLRREWSFEGLVMTDWAATGPGQADAVACLAAGNDLIMPGLRSDLKALRKGLRQGRVKSADLRRCAVNVLRAVLQSRTARDYPPPTP